MRKHEEAQMIEENTKRLEGVETLRTELKVSFQKKLPKSYNLG